MNLKNPITSKPIDLNVVKTFLLDRIRADESKVGKVAKVVGIVASVLSFFEYFLHGPLVVASTDVTLILVGFGVSSLLYGLFTQDKDLEKMVSFESARLKAQLKHFLKNVREEFDADGAFMCKYHNGDSFGTYPDSRFTMVEADTKSGVYEDETDFYNQPMEIYAKAYKRMNEQGFAELTVHDASPEMQFLMAKQGITRMVLVPVKKPLSDACHGMIGIKFVDEQEMLRYVDVEKLVGFARQATGVIEKITIKKLS